MKLFYPFAGVGSEVYSPVSMGRKAIGIELKDSYYKQMILNLDDAEKRFKETDQSSRIDSMVCEFGSIAHNK